MRKTKIGTKHFEGVVDITDPCYNKGVWCRTTAIVKSGTYECDIWRHTEKIERNGQEHIFRVVGIIGIYLDGVIPPQKKMEYLDEIGVDAGLAGFFMNKPDYSDEEWSKLCNLTRDGVAWITDDGFFSNSGYGDGCYRVYASKNEAEEITAIEIRFI